MITLSKIKLINWHYFTNVNLDIKGGCLITGNNGSGKSTILDAIQYVLVGNMREVSFNSSAHSETKRDLLGYLRCKTGGDTEHGARYLRVGDISSYVVLEFYDNKRRESLLIGVVADSYSDNNDLKTNFFKIEDAQITEQLFLQNKVPLNRTLFRQYLRSRKNAKAYNTVEEYRQDVLRRFGIDDHRFFKLFVKAIAFKPITDIREFIYNYVLEEKPVQIETMRDTIIRYRDYERLCELTKNKIHKLEAISRINDDIGKTERSIRVQEYIIKCAQIDSTKKQISDNNLQQQRLDTQHQKAQDEYNRLNNEKKNLEKERNSLNAAIAGNAAYQRKQSLTEKLAQLEHQLQQYNATKDTLMGLATQEKQVLKELLAQTPPEHHSTFQHGIAVLTSITDGSIIDPPAAKMLFNELRQDFKAVTNQLYKEQADFQNKLHKLEDEKKEITTVLTKLHNNKRAYPSYVTELISAISEFFRSHGKSATVRPLCEFLEIKDEQWRNAVEGYLNTRRFDLIVEPQNFDAALQVYEHFKDTRKVAGAGLVNTQKLLARGTNTVKNSLVEEVETDNEYAWGYACQSLGQIVKVDDELKLKQHRRSITKTGMTYQNNVARKIKPQVYATPYIGQGAIQRQIEIFEQQQTEVMQKIASIKQQCDLVTKLLELTSDRESNYVLLSERLPVLSRIKECQSSIKQAKKELSHLDLQQVEELNARLNTCQQHLQNIGTTKEALQKKMGGIEINLNNCQRSNLELELTLKHQTENRDAFMKQYPDESEEAQNRYQKEFKKQPLAILLTNFDRSKKRQETIILNLREDMHKNMSQYNADHQLGGGQVNDFIRELKRLVASELPQYEEKIRIEREKAEVEFKEHFIFKLKENIEMAQEEFYRLNAALKEVDFGGEKYRFSATAEPKFKSLYDMIVDTDSIIFGGAGSIFNTAFQNKHKEALDELFDRIVAEEQQYVDSTLQEYTDYRAYLKYDIRITSSTGDVSHYSKVGREKSGGETQTPFYIAIVASFLQLYRHSSTDDTMRLMMFDEAFNRMDSDRVEKFMSFIKQFHLQPIVAAPTEKLQFITPYVGTTLLVMRDGNQAWVEDFNHAMKTLAEVAVSEVAVSHE